MPTTRVALLWHMHQPVYRDPVSGTYILPWVRLHATRSYYDMARVLTEFPGARATLNLVPSLLTQLQDYAAGTARDRFLDVTRTPAADLSVEDRAFVLRNFFMVDWETCVRPLPRYGELLQARGVDLARVDVACAATEVSVGALRDLQVLFNLAWFGFSAFEEEPSLRALREKGRDYTEDDKLELLRVQQKIVGQVMPALAAVARSGQAELTVTPFYHPILPLLCDSDAALRAMPHAQLPPRFRHPEDARTQVMRALDFAEAHLGVRPQGMWPAEGSVSPEALEVFAGCGVKYLCSDEDVLLRSLPAASRARDLPHTYEVAAGAGQSLRMLFRDRGLSDLIGFTYARSPAADAVNDLLGHLARIGADATGEVPTVGVFLDGENPWEHYPNSGRDFLRGLYGALDRRQQGVEPVTLREAFEKDPPTRKVERIHSGSWIESNFRIWIGHPEDNAGWTLLGQARRLLDEKQAQGFDAAACAAALDALLVAEGSDWFWWYGDDFSSESLAEFDALFRGYVRRAFELLGEVPPAGLDAAISKRARASEAPSVREPDVLLTPPLDGTARSFFGWTGAATYRPGSDHGAMHQGPGLFAELSYAFDLGQLYLRLDPKVSASELLARVDALELTLQMGDAEQRFSVPLAVGELTVAQGDAVAAAGAMGEVVALGLRFSALGYKPGDRAGFFVRALERGLEVERLPRSGTLRFTVPGPAFAQTHWRV